MTQQAAHPRRVLSGVAPCWVKLDSAVGHRLHVVVAGLRAQAAAAAQLIPAGVTDPAAAGWVWVLRVLVVGAVCWNSFAKLVSAAKEGQKGKEG